MQSKAATVKEYLASLPADRKGPIEAVRKLILDNLDRDIEEGMSYGMITYCVPHRVYAAGYHCDPKQALPVLALASQKQYMSLYLACVGGEEHEKAFRKEWAEAGKNLDRGKVCVRFKKLEDVALDVVAKLVKQTTAKKYIAYYEASRAKSGKPVKATGAGKKVTKKAAKKAAR